MKYVRRYVQDQQACFAKTLFFRQLDESESLEKALSFIRRLTFFVMVFQDILRLNESRVQNATLRGIARHHRSEDRGHDLWFLQDLTTIEGSVPDTRELFATNSTTRDAAYQLMSEVFTLEDDRARIALLVVLEATGNVFFTSVVTNLDRLGITDKLLYFSRKHLDIELSHEIFEEEMRVVVDAIELTPDESKTILALVDRSFEAMTTMVNALFDQPDQQDSPSSKRPSFVSIPPSNTIGSRRWITGEAVRKRASTSAE